MSDASKRPWSCKKIICGQKIVDAYGADVAVINHIHLRLIHRMKANAQHIVQCVNMHEQCVEAMRVALDAIDIDHPVGNQAVAAALLRAAISAAEDQNGPS